MLNLYPSLVESVIEFQRYSLKIQANFHEREWNETKESTTTGIAEDYSIVLLNNYYYCLKPDETIENRLK
jgi:hypothetical protein